MLIYKITNVITNKVYIGQTTKTLSERIQNHHNSMVSNVNTHLYNAMRKYGWDNFKFEIIAEAQTQQELDELETYYIQLYDSIQNGYNMTPGGNNNPMRSVVVSEKHIAKMRSPEVRKKISESMKASYQRRGGVNEEHRKHLSESRKMLYASDKGDAIKDKFRQSFKFSPEHFRALNDAKNKAVYCVNVEGQVVAEFTRVKDAALWWYNSGYAVKRPDILLGRIKQSAVENKFIRGLKWIYRV